MGEPAFNRSKQKGTSERLVEALLSQKLMDRQDLEKALSLQRQKGGSLSQLLVQLKLVDAKTLAAALSRILKIPTISLSKMELDPVLSKVISRKQAIHHQIVPISRLGNQLTVAMVDPMNILALDDLAHSTGLVLVPFIATPEDIHDALNRLYVAESMSDTLEALNIRSEPSDAFELLSAEEGGRVESVEELIRKTQEGPVVRLTNAILSEGVTLKASDILMEPFEHKLRIRYRVDGAFREGPSPPPNMHAGMVSRIKVMSNLNIAEHRLPQDGRIKFSVQGREVDFRVSIIPSYYGEKACLRILDKEQAQLDINRLGFDPEPLVLLKEAVQHPHGMVLLTGPTGSGKTTTMYALLKLVDRPELNIVTIEDPIEYDLIGINQVSVHPAIGLSFAAGLRSILRQDPNVILVGEIRDAETADIAVKAALTGHLVLSTLHANDALGAVARLENMGVEPYLIASSVLLVGAQRLPRRVCPDCAVPVHPSQELIQRFDLPQNGIYRKGKGCLKCRRTGLIGRVGLLEAVPLIPELRKLVDERVSSVKLREAALQAGFISLREHAIAKAVRGIIPLEEVARTTVGYQE